jgi:hypothetical protein
MITVQGTFLKADGTPETGSLEFYAKNYVLESAGTTVVVPSIIKVNLDPQGYISVTIPSTDDPDWKPSGWTYTLVFKLSGDYSAINVAIPYDTPGGILSVSQLVPTSSVSTPPSNGGSEGPFDASVITSGVFSVARLPVGVLHNQVAFGDHLHDDRYYTEAEVNTALSAKVNTSALAPVATSGSYDDLINKPAIGDSAVTSVAGRTGDVTLTKSDVGLANVDNTTDLNKPISTATQAALDAKAAVTSLATVATSGSYTDLANKPTIPTVPVSSVAGKTGAVTLTKSDVGLANVDNTSDASKPVSTATTTALLGKANSTHTHAQTDITGLSTALGAKADTASLATVATTGSYSDLTGKPTIPTVPVTSVAGKTGDVALIKGDVGLANVDNTADLSKPISTATQTALNGKEATGVASGLVTAHNSSTTGVHGIADTSVLVTQTQLTSAIGAIIYPVVSVAGRTGAITLAKADVGLGNVDNTADTAKPVSTAQQAALDLKANLASPTFTGTVSGISKSMVGLGSVDNTADTAKPVSTAQQTALNLKVDKSAYPGLLVLSAAASVPGGTAAGTVIVRTTT